MHNYTYTVSRMVDGRVRASVQDQDGSGWPLNPKNDLFNHSPDGFEFGYSGSGPAQLALAILAHHFSDSERFKPFESFAPSFQDMLPCDGLAVKFHQQFKFRVIANIPRHTTVWEITSDDIDRAVMGMAFPAGVMVQA